MGNLLHRYDYSGDKTLHESFDYDDLNRLKWSEVSGRERITLEYDAWGNIRHKSDVGDYRYGSECQQGAGPHALCETSDGQRYWYDANGNMLGDSSGRRIEYSSFDKPLEITKGGHTTRFAYSPSRARYLRSDQSSHGATTVTRYLGNVERITHPNGRLEVKRTLPGGALISYTLSASGEPAGKTTHYLHTDHLGSLDTISDEIGQLVAQMSFDAWGQRRNALDWDALIEAALRDFDSSITDITKRGFTGHEMLDEVGVIHMNGRIYDPRLGRFMQADPIIDGVTDTQGYNRYSYVHNNPLNATDPSGFSSWNSFRDNLLKPVIQAIVTAYCIPCGAALAAATAVYYGGSFADAAIAAFTTAVMANMGQEFAANGFGATEALAFGYVGGITSALRGGKFGHGFVSAYAGAAVNASGILEGANQVEQFGANVVIAGTISEATGGKFANGAAYAAFNWALAQGVNGAAKRGVFSSDKKGSADETLSIDSDRRRALDNDLDILNKEISTLEEFRGPDAEQRAIEWIEEHVYSLSVDHGVELGVNGFRNFGIKLGRVVTDYHPTEISRNTLFGGISTDNLEFSWHSHPMSVSNGPSPEDYGQAAYLRQYRNFKDVNFWVTYRNHRGIVSREY